MAYLFPGQGQGSIKVGMGYEFCHGFKGLRKMFSDADRYLQRPLSDICFFGPEEELLKTINAQPASVVVNLVCTAFLDKETDFSPRKPDYLAGHSAGYIAALVYSGAVSFHQGLEIAQKRAELMGMACSKITGKMVALIDPDIVKIERLCHDSGVAIANYNSETQIVLSGPLGQMDRMIRIIHQQGLARKSIPLKIEGPSHSECMRSVHEPFARFLRKIPFSDPGVPIIGNSQAQIISTGEEAKKEMTEQLCSPVLWIQSIERLRENNVTVFVETGWGRVLSSNLKRYLREGEKVISVDEIIKE